MSKIINILGSPGVGKSTLATNLFSYMKRNGYSVEYVDEFAKHKVYENNKKALSCQPYIFGEQLYKIEILKNSVDYIINDSPLILSSIYNATYPESFNDSVIEIYKMYNYKTFLIEPNFKVLYQEAGRIHNQEESYEIYHEIFSLLKKEKIDFIEIDVNNIILEELVKKING